MTTLVLAGLSFCRVDFPPAKAQLSFTRANTCMNEKQPISFPGWKSALAGSNLPAPVRSSHTTEILTFLHSCKKSRSPATVASIRQWLAGRELASNGAAHAALRWFYRSALKVDAHDRHGVRGNPHPD